MCVCVQITFDATQSRNNNSMPISMCTDAKFLSTKLERLCTVLGWLNISRSKYATHACKENLLYRHVFAYLYDINDAILPNILDSPFKK